MSVNLVLEIILLLSGASAVLLLVRAIPRTADLSEEELLKYSIKPHLLKVLKEFEEFRRETIHILSKKLLHWLAIFSKHTHRISTNSIAHIERKKSENSEENGKGKEGALEESD